MKLIILILTILAMSSCSIIREKNIKEYNNLTQGEKDIYNNLNPIFSHKDRIDIIKYW